ncbi:MAG: hypothetical protein U7123_05865 [Potamolinea sp.]
MINFESFIPEEITLALKHPLAQNLELPIPDANIASLQEILEFQQPEHFPGVVKRIIPLDADTFWEYWWCVPDRLLLPFQKSICKQGKLQLAMICGFPVPWILPNLLGEGSLDHKYHFRSMVD